jgi:hypothetical protein
MKETDLAQIVRAKDAVKRIDAIRKRLCFRRVNDEMIEALSEALSDIVAALELATLAINSQRKNEEEWHE